MRRSLLGVAAALVVFFVFSGPAMADGFTLKGDVIGQHVDSPTPQIVAQERGVYGTGHHRDLRQFAPKATLCSSVWVWDKFLTPELKKIIAGNWSPRPTAPSSK